jgi:hypothetical protein
MQRLMMWEKNIRVDVLENISNDHIAGLPTHSLLWHINCPSLPCARMCELDYFDDGSGLFPLYGEL